MLLTKGVYAQVGVVPLGIDSTKVYRRKLTSSGFEGARSENSAFGLPRHPDLSILPSFWGYGHDFCFASMNRDCINESWTPAAPELSG